MLNTEPAAKAPVVQFKSMIHPSRKDRHSSLEKTPRPEPEEINKEQDYIQHPSGGKMYFST